MNSSLLVIWFWYCSQDPVDINSNISLHFVNTNNASAHLFCTTSNSAVEVPIGIYASTAHIILNFVLYFYSMYPIPHMHFVYHNNSFLQYMNYFIGLGYCVALVVNCMGLNCGISINTVFFC